MHTQHLMADKDSHTRTNQISFYNCIETLNTTAKMLINQNAQLHGTDGMMYRKTIYIQR